MRIGAAARIAGVLLPVFAAVCTPPVSSAASRFNAEAAPADTSFDRFLNTLSDSTDRYFGIAATPLDSLVLDSLEANPPETKQRRPSFGFLPTFGFSRVDGSTFGASVHIEGPPLGGQIKGGAAYAVSSETWLGGGSYERIVRRHETRWTFGAGGGRELCPMNRDYDEKYLDMARALTNGTDRSNYLRNDGWRAGVERERGAVRASLGYRDMLESPLPTTATWNLLGHDLEVTENLPAGFGRARELAFSAGARLPALPIRLEADYWTSGPAIGSDFAYDRVRVAAGGDFSVGRFASLVPQVAWGTLRGDETPQQSFYLGAGPTLGSIRRDALAGTAFAMAKLDVIGVADVLQTLRLPHPAALFLQGGAFVAGGGVAGADPYGGPERAGDDWPAKNEWLSEAGISLRYSPIVGVVVRMSESWPLGPTDRKERFVFVISHPLDLLRREPIGDDD